MIVEGTGTGISEVLSWNKLGGEKTGLGTRCPETGAEGESGGKSGGMTEVMRGAEEELGGKMGGAAESTRGASGRGKHDEETDKTAGGEFTTGDEELGPELSVGQRGKMRVVTNCAPPRAEVGATVGERNSMRGAPMEGVWEGEAMAGLSQSGSVWEDGGESGDDGKCGGNEEESFLRPKVVEHEEWECIETCGCGDGMDGTKGTEGMDGDDLARTEREESGRQETGSRMDSDTCTL